MKLVPSLAKVLIATVFTLSFASAVSGQTPPPAPPKAKNWTAPAQKIYAQEVYTMFAGSFPERIGNPDDPDDIDVITKGITIVDPRWNKADPVKKFVMMLPLRDASNGHLGLLVLAYKNPANSKKTEKDFFVASTALRDGLKKKIPSYADLFKPAK